MMPGEAEELRDLRRDYERNVRLIRVGYGSWRWVADAPDDDEHQADAPKSDRHQEGAAA
jgi:hypothetical protein